MFVVLAITVARAGSSLLRPRTGSALISPNPNIFPNVALPGRNFGIVRVFEPYSEQRFVYVVVRVLSKFERTDGTVP